MPVLIVAQVDIHPKSLTDISTQAKLVRDSPSSYSAVKLTSADVRLANRVWPTLINTLRSFWALAVPFTRRVG